MKVSPNYELTPDGQLPIGTQSPISDAVSAFADRAFSPTSGVTVIEPILPTGGPKLEKQKTDWTWLIYIGVAYGLYRLVRKK